MKFVFWLLMSFSFVFSLTLDRALELAIKNHTSSKLSLLDIEKARENIKKARAGILPQLSFSYSYTRLGGELAFGFTPKNRHSYTFELDQAIFDKSVFEGLSLARNQEELQRLVYEDVLREVQFQTKQLFYALLYKKEVVKIAQENLRYWEENLRLAQTKFEAGILPKVELMRAKAQLEKVKADFEKAVADYKKSLEDFKSFLKYEGEDIEPEGELKAIEYKQEDYEKLLENNSTIKVAKKSLEVLEKAVEVQKAQYYPSLSAFATYQGNTARLGGSDKMVEGYTFGVRFNYKIFDGFAREANVAQAKLDVLKQMENLKDVETSQRAELKKTLLDLESLKAQLRALELSLESAKESLRLSTERYKFGVASQLEVLDAINNYNSLLESYYYTLYLYNTSLARLERLTR